MSSTTTFVGGVCMGSAFTLPVLMLPIPLSELVQNALDTVGWSIPGVPKRKGTVAKFPFEVPLSWGAHLDEERRRTSSIDFVDIENELNGLSLKDIPAWLQYSWRALIVTFLVELGLIYLLRSVGKCFKSGVKKRSWALPMSTAIGRTKRINDGFGLWDSWEDASQQAKIKHGSLTAERLFDKFRVSDDLGIILGTFVHLYHLAVDLETSTSANHIAEVSHRPPWDSPGEQHRFPFTAIDTLLGKQNHKARQLKEKLEQRCKRPEYVASPCAEKLSGTRRAVVVGAGPSGLRTAIELRLLGAHVTVVEQRCQFTRPNRLHLWPWCGEEIKLLGAKCLEPPPIDFGGDPDVLNIGIAELQTLLLKTALLLGVQVILGVEYKGVSSPGNNTNGWTVQCVLDRGVRKRAQICNVAAVIGASGPSCEVGLSLSIEHKDVGNLRAEDAIGLVFSFAPLPASRSKQTPRSFKFARQYYKDMFKRLEDDTGAELENIVYMKSKCALYYVMTPTRKCLQQAGVFLNPSLRPLVQKGNVDDKALDSLVRRIVEFPFKAGEQSLPQVAVDARATLQYADGGKPKLFDFSGMRRASEGIGFIPPSCRSGEHLFVALSGDALIEPFWPEGLGIVRGFLAAMDVAWAAKRWADGASQDLVKSEFAAAFTQLKSLAAQTREKVLRDSTGFTLDPGTRYREMQ